MDEPYLGLIIMFGGNYAPRGWAFCNGQLLSIAEYTALYSILGTTYGGDGQTTFALPDLRGRAPLHSGQGRGLTPRDIGESSGEEDVTLISVEMPVHSHTVNPQFSNTPGQVSPANNYASNLGAPNAVYGSSGDGPMGAAVVSIAGGTQPHENMQPWLCINYIIALEGIYPSRN